MCGLMYLFMSISLYVWTHVSIHVYIFICVDSCIYSCLYLYMCGLMYLFMSISLYVWTHVSIHVYIFICVDSCIYFHVFVFYVCFGIPTEFVLRFCIYSVCACVHIHMLSFSVGARRVPYMCWARVSTSCSYLPVCMSFGYNTNSVFKKILLLI